MKKTMTALSLLAAAGIVQATTEAPTCVPTEATPCAVIADKITAKQASGNIIRDDLTEDQKLELIHAAQAAEAQITDAPVK